MPTASNIPTIPSKLSFPVVGIGLSAGGMPSLQQILTTLPPSCGMAFVVVLHLSPEHESELDALIQRWTSMPVTQVSKPMQIESDHIYVIPANKLLAANDGYLSPKEMDRSVGTQIAIDLFFRTMAEAHRERAITVLLSGAGSDGTVGLQRTKEQGGVTIVQDPKEAEYDSMPLAAIASGAVDFVLPAGQIPAKLLELRDNARAIRMPPLDADASSELSSRPPDDGRTFDDALQRILMLLRTHTGHDFRHYKRATVLRRIERRLQVRGVAGLAEYAALLDEDGDEHAALLKDMLIGVTNFFRDRDAFIALETAVLPDMLRAKEVNEQFRVWVAACSTGEEAYSLAMVLQDQIDLLAKPVKYQIFASDIDESAIAFARASVYPPSIASDVPNERLSQYFTKQDNNYQVRKSVRDKVLFASHNLLRDPPFSKLDLISCRNLLIYLNREMQMHLLEMLHFSLNPGGVLFLGSSDSAEMTSHLFTPVDKKNRIYRAKALSRSTRFTPPLSSSRPQIMRPIESAVQTAPAKRQFSYAEIHQRVLAQHAPPSIVVNQESDIVHMSDRAGAFLRHAGGEPSRNLLTLVHPELRLELRTALFQAIKSRKSVEARRVRLARGDRTYFVNMTVRPFHDEDADADLVLVLFDEVEQTMSPDVDEGSGEKKDSVLIQLEDELQRTKHQLQETIEHAEVSNEELRASNEELQAINEELRSATEELETSKEELQSINEELVTVNYELKMKVEETGKVNDDLNNLIASADIATIFVDRGIRIKRFTPRVADIFNIIPTDIGRSLLDITHKLNYPELSTDTILTFDTLQPVEREVRSQDERVYIVRLLPYRTTEDRIEGAVMTFFDITSRREAEERLRAGEEHLRQVAESMGDYAIITLDPDGRITTWNRGAERMFGHSRDEAIGKPSTMIFVPEEREAGVPEEELRRARIEGRAEDDRWHLRKDGTRLFCRGVTTPLGKNAVNGYAKIARDETERYLAGDVPGAQVGQQQMHRITAQTARRMADSLLGAVSHELKQPLNLINMNAELLLRLPETAASATGLAAAELICRAAKEQAHLLDEVLDLSRLRAGKLKLALEEMDLSASVGLAISELLTDPAAAGKDINVDDDAGALSIEADPKRIQQVLVNLLSNAVRSAAPGGKIRLRLTKEEGMARLDVMDNGRGIDPELLPRLFEIASMPPFARRKGSGLGIGLSLVHQIVTMHGGRIEAASEGIGQGACFSVWLPLKATDAGTLDGAVMRRTAVTGRRVLVIDADEAAAASMKALLELEGATAITAGNTADGLKALGDTEIDVILVDLAPMDASDQTFLQHLHRQPHHRHLPVVALGELNWRTEATQALDAGYAAYLSKPISIDQLLSVLGDIIAVA